MPAIIREDTLSVYCLLERGITVSPASITETIRAGNFRILQAVLDKGADINHLDNSGYDELYTVLELGIPEYELAVRTQVESGAVVNRTYPDGKTILSFVDKEKNPQLWQYLSDRGAKSSVTQQ